VNDPTACRLLARCPLPLAVCLGSLAASVSSSMSCAVGAQGYATDRLNHPRCSPRCCCHCCNHSWRLCSDCLFCGSKGERRAAAGCSGALCSALLCSAAAGLRQRRRVGIARSGESDARVAAGDSVCTPLHATSLPAMQGGGCSAERKKKDRARHKGGERAANYKSK
jgi:hypothetical protein